MDIGTPSNPDPQAPPWQRDYTQVLEQIAKEIAAGFDQLCQVMDMISKRQTPGSR